MSRWIKWWYHDENGKPVFQHYRIDDPDSPRGKRYGYRYPTKVRDNVVHEWDWTKHPLADSLIYRLHWVLANPTEPLFVTEGERDADEFLSRGYLATSHHGGANKFTPQQAEWLRGHKGDITLVADRDAAGAYDVCRRYDLLRAVGIPASRLAIVRGVPRKVGADARDHFEAGYTVEDFRPVSLPALRKVAATATPSNSAGSWPDACTPEEIEQAKTWRPKTVPRCERTPAATGVRPVKES
jgi:hypothetical protein